MWCITQNSNWFRFQTWAAIKRFNYQSILDDKVIDYLIEHQHIEEQFKQFAEGDFVHPAIRKAFHKLLVEPPSNTQLVEEPVAAYTRSLSENSLRPYMEASGSSGPLARAQRIHPGASV